MWNWGRRVDIVEIMGGLGNQMFQYAYGLYLQHYRHPSHLVWIDLSTTMSHYSKHNGWEIDRLFGCQLPVVESDLLHRVSRSKGRFGVYRMFIEPQEGYYHPIDYRGICKYRHHTGYWQHQGYLSPIEPQLREAFRFSATLLSAQTINIAHQIDQQLSVSLHVRRGDYVHDPQAAVVHGNVCTAYYYQQAILWLQRKLELPMQFYIFSDDPQWVSQTFDLPNQRVISHNRGGTAGRICISCLGANII